MMRPVIGENGNLIMTKQGDSLEYVTETNKRMIESILCGTAETIGLICEYRNLLKRVEDCKQIFSYEIATSLSAPPPSVQFAESDVSIYDTTFQPRHVAMLLEKFVQIEKLSMVDITSFIFVIEDLIVLSKEASMEKGIYLPDAWMKLKTSHLTKLSNIITVQRGYINWKNFLIACMNLPYPSQTDIIDVLGQFRILDPDVTNCVDKNKFDLVTLWFESIDPIIIATDLTSLRWRECIYQLFCDNFNYFQYVEFLLYFCKHIDPRVGLANSLALLTGHLISVEELLGIDPLGSDNVDVTDSELEMLFSEEDLLIKADFEDETGELHPMGQKVNLTRRMTRMKLRREKLHELEHLEAMHHEEELDEESDEGEEPHIPAGPPVSPEIADLTGFFPDPHHTREKSHSEQKSPRNSLDATSGEIATLTKRLSHGEALEISFELEGNELEDETETELEGEVDEYEGGHNWGGLSDEDGRETSPRVGRKSADHTGGSKPEKKRKKNRRADSLALDKTKRDASKEKAASGKKKGSRKAKQQDQHPVEDKTENQAASGSGPLDQTRSLGSDDLLQAQKEVEETEQEEETETEEVEEEEQEPEVIDRGSLIPLEAFLQSLWFGHITAYPIRNQSFLSSGFEKMKELSESVYEEYFMHAGRDVLDPYSASLTGILKHPFVRETLKRYKGFEILDLASKLRDVLNMPEDEDDGISDTESWPDSDSTLSIDLSPLPPSPMLTASSFNDSFSEIFSCMSLQTNPSGASIKSGSIEAKHLSRGSALSFLVKGMSQTDEEEVESEPPISNVEMKYPIPEDSDSEPEFGDVLGGSKSFTEILSPGLDTPHSFGSQAGSLEDIGSAEDINACLKRYEEENCGENVECGDDCRCAYCLCDSQIEEDLEVELPSSSTESLELKLAAEEARSTQIQKSSKYSPMTFGLDPNMGSLLW